MKKLLCALVLCLSLIAGCSVQPEVSEEVSLSKSDTNSNSSVSEIILENTEYEYKIEDQSVTILKYKGNSTEVIMPDEIDGYPVKKIKSAYLEDNVKTVYLPKYVEEFAVIFVQTYVNEVFIPDSVHSIREDAFDECPRELVLLYDNNPIVPKYAEEHNILCFKRSEYNPVLTVELVNGKPLNDDENQGISQEDYNLVKRRNKTYVDRFMFYVSNGYIDFNEYEEFTNETIKDKIMKTSILLYECGIIDFNLKDIKNATTDYLDNMVTFAIYSRFNGEIDHEDIKGSTGIFFADDEKTSLNHEIFFGIGPDYSKITGYSQQQKGIWYYPKDFPKVQTEVLLYSGNVEKMEYTLKLRFTPESGSPIDKTFSYKLTEEGTVGGDHHRITLMGIQ